MVRVRIVVDDLTGTAIAELLEEHLTEMRSTTPPESKHALTLDALREPEITFWTVWDGDELVGCGALKRLDDTHGEVKSMRTARGRQRRGVASALLARMVDEARAKGMQRLSLETGSGEFFDPARRLYEKFGFAYCEPFGDYIPDPYSVFMTRTL
jgi:putative acetyltransferase